MRLEHFSFLPGLQPGQAFWFHVGWNRPAQLPVQLTPPPVSVYEEAFGYFAQPFWDGVPNFVWYGDHFHLCRTQVLSLAAALELKVHRLQAANEPSDLPSWFRDSEEGVTIEAFQTQIWSTARQLAEWLRRAARHHVVISLWAI